MRWSILLSVLVLSLFSIQSRAQDAQAYSQDFTVRYEDVAPAVGAFNISSDSTRRVSAKGCPLDSMGFEIYSPEEQIMCGGCCPRNRWNVHDNSALYYMDSDQQLAMYCQRVEFDRSSDIAASGQGPIGRAIYNNVIVRFRKSFERNADEANRNYIDVEVNGVSQRMNISREYKLSDCDSNGVVPSGYEERSRPRCDGSTSFGECLIRNTEISIKGQGLQFRAQF